MQGKGYDPAVDKLISCFFEKLAYLLIYGKLNFRILIGGLTFPAAI